MEWGQAEAVALALQMERCFDDLYASRPRYAHSMLRFHLVHLVLPVLALYQSLLGAGLDQDAALSEAERIFECLLRRLLQSVALMSRMSGSFSAFRRITRGTIRLGFPSTGWEIEPVEDSELAIAFNYHRCFYLDILRAYGASELTTLFCKADDWLAEVLPAVIRWERTTTLARGGGCCDFRWSLLEPPEKQGTNTRPFGREKS
jgi:hypothetical protein